jgi:hypothetical protein
LPVILAVTVLMVVLGKMVPQELQAIMAGIFTEKDEHLMALTG